MTKTQQELVDLAERLGYQAVLTAASRLLTVIEISDAGEAIGRGTWTHDRWSGGWVSGAWSDCNPRCRRYEDLLQRLAMRRAATTPREGST